MPESGAVYQPTTVGYSYDSGRNVPGVGIMTGFSRLMSRQKLISKQRFEWFILAISICAIVAGFAMMFTNILKDRLSENDSSGLDAVIAGACFLIFGSLLGVYGVWLKWFSDRKSVRGGLTNGSSGAQMFGGMNPSTDLLVGSTSQYGPVLTEVPKLKTNDTPAVPLSDHEEETRTLMPDSSAPQNTSGPHTIADQIPG